MAINRSGTWRHRLHRAALRRVHDPSDPDIQTVTGAQRLNLPIADTFTDSLGRRTGDGNTPNAATHNRQFQQTNGASYRELFDLSDWDKGLATSTPGQSGQPGSPHYDDLLPM